mmetsp:Transcript_108832/g.347397  ORF Transcript_108832/g.347397 Transcript_108832/m.347397 type:complete len:304 (+) Transcript_108832:297-1208(+)
MRCDQCLQGLEAMMPRLAQGRRARTVHRMLAVRSMPGARWATWRTHCDRSKLGAKDSLHEVELPERDLASVPVDLRGRWHQCEHYAEHDAGWHCLTAEAKNAFSAQAVKQHTRLDGQRAAEQRRLLAGPLGRPLLGHAAPPRGAAQGEGGGVDDVERAGQAAGRQAQHPVRLQRRQLPTRRLAVPRQGEQRPRRTEEEDADAEHTDRHIQNFQANRKRRHPSGPAQAGAQAGGEPDGGQAPSSIKTNEPSLGRQAGTPVRQIAVRERLQDTRGAAERPKKQACHQHPLVVLRSDAHPESAAHI